MSSPVNNQISVAAQLNETAFHDDDVNPYVYSAIDLEETFKTLAKSVEKQGHGSSELIEQVVSLMEAYSQSPYKRVVVAIKYIMPCFA